LAVAGLKSRILDIPEPYRPGLVIIANLSPPQFEELVSALQRAPECSTAKDLSAWLTPEVKSISSSDVPKVIEALTSLYRVKVRTEIPAEIVARDVVYTMRESGIPELVAANDTAQQQLAKLLSQASLNVLETKAKELRSEYEHTLCDSRIFTDIRPVFGGNVGDAPSTMLIVHTLRLGYHDEHESRHRELHIALNSEDLKALRAVIERAEVKEKTLRSQLQSAGIKPIEIA
jgi:hypothetical protein